MEDRNSQPSFKVNLYFTILYNVLLKLYLRFWKRRESIAPHAALASDPGMLITRRVPFSSGRPAGLLGGTTGWGGGYKGVE